MPAANPAACARFLAALDDPANFGRSVGSVAESCGVNPNSAATYAQAHRPNRPRAKGGSAANIAKRNRVIELLATDGAADLSDKEIGRRCGVHYTMVESCWREHFDRIDFAWRLAHPAGLALAVVPAPEDEADGADESVLARRIAAFYRWQARKVRLGKPRGGYERHTIDPFTRHDERMATP